MTSEKIIFYAMNGCGHCDNAKDALAEEINSGKIKVLSNFEAPYGVQGFPHFVNTKNKKTLTGWPGSKNNLLEKLDCVELFGDDDDIDAFFKPTMPIKENFSDLNLLPHKRFENFEMENYHSYPVVERMEPVSTDVLYQNHTGGYSKLSNCWVKQANYTA